MVESTLSKTAWPIKRLDESKTYPYLCTMTLINSFWIIQTNEQSEMENRLVKNLVHLVYHVAEIGKVDVTYQQSSFYDCKKRAKATTIGYSNWAISTHSKNWRNVLQLPKISQKRKTFNVEVLYSFAKLMILQWQAADDATKSLYH